MPLSFARLTRLRRPHELLRRVRFCTDFSVAFKTPRVGTGSGHLRCFDRPRQFSPDALRRRLDFDGGAELCWLSWLDNPTSNWPPADSDYTAKHPPAGTVSGAFSYSVKAIPRYDTIGVPC